MKFRKKTSVNNSKENTKIQGKTIFRQKKKHARKINFVSPDFNHNNAFAC